MPSGNGRSLRTAPSRCFQSTGFTPAALTSTSSSPSAGTGSGRSTSSRTLSSPY
nr:hypothetical protein [Streptomyces sp. CC210A]